MSQPFDKGMKESYERLAHQKVELARHVRDTIAKSDDTKRVYKLLTNMLQMSESRVLMDMGEGRHANGDRFTAEDFWSCVGEVRGLRRLEQEVKKMVDIADKADEDERKKQESSPKTA